MPPTFKMGSKGEISSTTERQKRRVSWRVSAHSRHATVRLRAAGAGKEKGEPDVNLIFCLLIRKR